MATPFPTPAPGDVWGQQLIDIITEHKEAAVTEAVEAGNATFAARTNLIDDLPSKFYIAHRGSPNLYPEHSMEGYRASARAGFVIEADIQMLSDGTLVCHHDTGTNRTMTGTDVVAASLTRAGWLARRLKPAIPGGAPAMPVLWEDMLAEFGGRYPISAEIKTGSTAAVNAIIDSVKSRGLERSVNVNSFNHDAALAVAAAGISSGYAINSTLPGAVSTEIDWVICNTATSWTLIADLAAQGFKVIVYTVTDRTFADGVLAAGASGIFTDDPWFISGRYATQQRDGFGSLTGWPGFIPAGTEKTLVAKVDGTTRLEISSNTLTTLGQVGTVSRGQKVSFKYRHMAEGIGSHSARIYLHEAAKTIAESDTHWYLTLFRRGGGTNTYKKTTGTAGLLTPTSGVEGSFLPATPDGVESTVDLHVEIELTTTELIVRRLDTGAQLAYPAVEMTGPFHISVGTLTTSATTQFHDFLKR